MIERSERSSIRRIPVESASQEHGRHGRGLRSQFPARNCLHIVRTLDSPVNYLIN